MGSRFAPIAAFIVSAGLTAILFPTNARTACLDYSGGLNWQTGMGGSSPDDYGLVAVDGDLLVTSGVAGVKFSPPFFETFNVSDLGAPSRIDYEILDLEESIRDIAVLGAEYIAIAAEDLYLVEASGFPFGPDLGLNGVSEVARRDNLLFAAGSDGLSVIDVTDPMSATVIGTLGSVGSTTVEPVFSGDLLYYVDGTGVRIIDITTPSAPLLLATTPLGETIVDAALGTDLLLLSTGDRLLVHDLADPLAPALIASFEDPRGLPVRALATAGTVLFYGPRLTSVSLADPASPRLLGYHPYPAADLTIEDGNLYAAGGNDGVAVLSIADVFGRTEGTTVAERNGAVDLDLYEDRVLVLSVADGSLRVLTADTFTETARIDFFAAVQQLAVSDGVGLVIEEAGTAWTLDFSDVDAPSIVHSFSVGWFPYGLQADGPFFYYLNGSALRIYDLTDPSAPLLRGTVGIADYGRDLARSGSLCAVNRDASVELIDVSDPDAPAIVGQTSGGLAGIHLSGPYLYGNTISGNPTVLRTYDVSDPTSPTLVHTEPAPVMNGKFAQVGDHLYVGRRHGLAAFDLSVAAEPSFLGAIWGTDYSNPFALPLALPNGILLSDYWTQHLLPLQCEPAEVPGDPVDTAAQVLRLQTFPNPSHGTTVIKLRLEQATRGSVRILDASGRKVRELHHGVFSPGDQSWTWDGRSDRGEDVPAGVYFVRASAGGTDLRGTITIVR